MIVNQLFNNCGKGLNFIVKDQTEKPNKMVTKCCTKKPKLLKALQIT